MEQIVVSPACGCHKPVYGHGMCRNHWAQWYKNNPGPNRNRCSVEGCEKPRVGLGLCGMHYQRQNANGSTQATTRFLARTQKTRADGTRICYVCGIAKLRTSEFFGVDRRSKDGMRATCRECCKRSVRRWTRRTRYGITESEFNELLRTQDGSCAICSIVLRVGGRRKDRACIDHDHKTGSVRGLLCHHCNVLLGHAKDSAETLAKAAKYLLDR